MCLNLRSSLLSLLRAARRHLGLLRHDLHEATPAPGDGTLHPVRLIFLVGVEELPVIGEEQFLDMLRRAAFYANRTLQVIKVSGAGPDHPWLAHVPESRYLKAAFCRVE